MAGFATIRAGHAEQEKWHRVRTSMTSSSTFLTTFMTTFNVFVLCLGPEGDVRDLDAVKVSSRRHWRRKTPKRPGIGHSRGRREGEVGLSYD